VVITGFSNLRWWEYFKTYICYQFEKNASDAFSRWLSRFLSLRLGAAFYVFQILLENFFRYCAVLMAKNYGNRI
jgi:hypothetical protein